MVVKQASGSYCSEESRPSIAKEFPHVVVSFRTLRRSKSFVTTLVVFAVANVWSWLRHIVFPQCCDIEATIGFPVPFHISGGLAGAANFYLLGLLLDLVIAITLAITATWMMSLIRRLRL